MTGIEDQARPPRPSWTAVGRRTALRAGLLTTWTTPLVMTGVPAHAAACSTGLASLSVTHLPGGDQTRLPGDVVRWTGTFRVCNVGDLDSTITTVTVDGRSIVDTSVFTQLQVDDWPAATRDPPVILLAATGPGKVVAAGGCRDFSIAVLKKPQNPSTYVTLTFSGACGETAQVTVIMGFLLPEPV